MTGCDDTSTSPLSPDPDRETRRISLTRGFAFGHQWNSSSQSSSMATPSSASTISESTPKRRSSMDPSFLHSSQTDQYRATSSPRSVNTSGQVETGRYNRQQEDTANVQDDSLNFDDDGNLSHSSVNSISGRQTACDMHSPTSLVSNPAQRAIESTAVSEGSGSRTRAELIMDATARKTAQDSALNRVNTCLRRIVRPWKDHHSSDPSTKSGARQLEKRWTTLLETVKSCLETLRGLRQMKQSGAVWHNHAGIYADLPLSWFLHRQNLLDPARYHTLAHGGKAEADRSIDVLDRLLDKAEQKYLAKDRFSQLELRDFLREIGIDLIWRRKLGSLDIVKH